jgi:phosphoribosylglycinamide formyltransferase 1
MANIAILASHNGSGFDAIRDAIGSKDLRAKTPLLISNNANSMALKKAARYGIDNFVVNSKTHANADEEIYRLLKKYDCYLVFLSGYMKKLSPLLTSNFTIINSHPSLLPKHGGEGMYGRFVHEAVVKNGESESGVTIHEVNEHYDDGKILLQKEIALSDDETVDTLESKIKSLEKIAIVEALRQCLK